MVNRTLIRLKIVQLMYAFYLNDKRDMIEVRKELDESMSKAYELYNYLLLLMVAVRRYALRQIEKQERLNKTAHIDKEIDRRFVDNKFLIQLESNIQLNEYCQDRNISWDNDLNYVKKIYEKIIDSDIYKEFMSETEDGNAVKSYADDRELWRKLYKNVIAKDESLDELLEDQDLYWNDDRTIVDTFVIKTIKRFEEENGEEQELVPEFKDEEDREYARTLFSRCINNDEYYRSLIERCVKNWEFNRLAYMDIIIMQTALAEILSFPQIPVTVSINEYVEIAKWYSTPKSGGYVNGIIDAVVRMLRSEKKLMKE